MKIIRIVNSYLSTLWICTISSAFETMILIILLVLVYFVLLNESSITLCFSLSFILLLEDKQVFKFGGI